MDASEAKKISNNSKKKDWKRIFDLIRTQAEKGKTGLDLLDSFLCKAGFTRTEVIKHLRSLGYKVGQIERNDCLDDRQSGGNHLTVIGIKVSW